MRDRRMVAGWVVVPLLVLAGCPEDTAESGTDTDTDVGTNTDPAGTEATSASSSDGTTSNSGDPTTNTTPGTTTDPATSTSEGSDTMTSSTSETTDSDTGDVDPSTFAVTIDDVSSPPRLVKVSLATGAGTEVCDLPPGRIYDSITFGRDNTLFAHNASSDRLETIDPCDCGFQVIGPTSIGTVEITIDADDGLIGMDPEFNALLTVNPSTGLATVVGPLGVVLDAGGIAWSDDAQTALVIDATTDQLLVVDLETGMSTDMVTLSDPVDTPGVERDNVTGTLYVCSDDVLYSVDESNGDLTNVGVIGLDGPCDNLAVPFGQIACLE